MLIFYNTIQVTGTLTSTPVYIFMYCITYMSYLAVNGIFRYVYFPSKIGPHSLIKITQSYNNYVALFLIIIAHVSLLAVYWQFFITIVIR